MWVWQDLRSNRLLAWRLGKTESTELFRLATYDLTGVAELAELADVGSVCRDERSGVRRPATPALWAAGIEQMLAQRERLELPLANHHYLRAIVYGLADQADAAAERTREADLRQGRPRRAGGSGTGVSPPQPREDPLQCALRYIDQLHGYGQLSDAERAARRAEAIAKHQGEAP